MPDNNNFHSKSTAILDNYNSAVTGAFTKGNIYPGTVKSSFVFPTSYQCIVQFMRAMEQEVAPEPKWPDEATFRLRVRLMMEEDFETYRACYDANAVEILDGLVDKDYVSTGTAAAFGFPYELAFVEAHSSNMSKLDPATGKPKKDEYGKVTKPATYRAADFAQFVPDSMSEPPPYDTKEIVMDELTKALVKHFNVPATKKMP